MTVDDSPLDGPFSAAAPTDPNQLRSAAGGRAPWQETTEVERAELGTVLQVDEVHKLEIQLGQLRLQGADTREVRLNDAAVSSSDWD